MQINTNIFSLTTARPMLGADSSLARALQRLSSGLRINSAKDDAAGLAIGSRMTSQINGMDRAARNTADGVSFLQTAEGAMGTLTDALQRIRQLAVQAENSTNNATDKQALQAEVSQLLQEVDRVGLNTTFNGEQIFSQSRNSLGGDPTKRAVMDGLKLGWLEEAETLVSQYYGITGDGAGISIELTTFTDGAGGVAAQVSGTGGAGGKLTNLKLQVDMADFTPPNLPNGGSAPFYNDRIIAHEMVHAIMGRSMNFTALPTWFKEGAAEFIHGADERLAGDIAAAGGGNAGITSVLNTLSSWALDSAHYSSAYVATRYLNDKLKTAGEDGIKAMMTYLNQNPSADLDAAMTHFFGGGYSTASFVTEVQANGVNFVNNQMNLTNSDTGAVGGLDAGGGAIRTATTVLTDYGTTYGDNVLTGFNETFEKISNSTTGATELQFQVGAESGQTISTGVGAINSQALGINDIDLTTNARVAMVHIDQALDAINKERGKIGAQLSRFEKTIANLQTGSENLSASRSRIQDTDFAAETASLVRAQIMQKSIASVVAQANATPALALQLLRH